jgi:hypothetical protein
MDQIDQFIDQLYRLSSQIDAADFRWRTLQELNQYLDFDAALSYWTPIPRVLSPKGCPLRGDRATLPPPTQF